MPIFILLKGLKLALAALEDFVQQTVCTEHALDY
jgi:hypothetical protein